MLKPATRAGTVRWTSMLQDALRSVGVSLDPDVVASLNSLESYAVSPLSLYSDPVTGLRVAKSHSALLLALQITTSSWPTKLQEKLAPPPVDVDGREVFVSGPGMEMLIVLYNAAVGNCNTGLAAMQRVGADQARGGARASCAGTTPSADAKAAYKSFQMAAELAAYGEQAVAEESDKLLSPSDCYVVQQNFDFRTIREFAEMCVAVAKYVYSTTSGAVTKRHDTLAKLAHHAYTVRPPASLPSESLRFMTTLLLAAYHRHRAEHLNRASRVPDMSLVLGHITYARRLVRTVEQEFVESVASAAEAAASKDRKRQSAGGWQFLGRLSATLIGSQTTSSNNNGGNDTDENDSSEPPFKRLTELLHNSDLVKVFPLANNLIRDISTLYDQYQHENDVVYYTRAAREEDVVADAPEVDSLTGSSGSPREVIPLAMKLSADMEKFSALPSAKTLWDAVKEHETTREIQDGVGIQLEETQKLIHDMEAALVLPPDVEFELDRLQALLHGERGVALTLDERIDKACQSVAHAMRRLEEESELFCRARREHRSQNVTELAVVTGLKRRERTWRRDADALRATLQRDLPHRCEAALRESLLLPEGAALRQCVERAGAAVARAKETLQWGAESTHECSRHATELRALRRESTAALERMSSLRTPSRWDRLRRALSEAAAVIAAADKLVEAAETETQLMETLKSHMATTQRPTSSEGRLSSADSEERQQQQKENAKEPKGYGGRSSRRAATTRRRKYVEEEEEENDELEQRVAELRSTSGQSWRNSTKKEEPVTESKVERSPPSKPARRSTRSSKAPEDVDNDSKRNENVKPPMAVFSPSLLDRIRRREQELEEEEEEESKGEGLGGFSCDKGRRRSRKRGR